MEQPVREIKASQFLFSVITPIYNTEKYLEEAIESILAQDIGFEEHVQLVLIDDGSTDNSGKICDEYARNYQGNILVIHQENSGVSSARNAGLKYAAGKYINFMDGDDKLSKNALSKVEMFFEKYGEIVDLVSIPMIFFDGRSGDHELNGKYKKGTRIIDLEKEYDKVQLSMASAFFQRNAVGNIQFDTRLRYAEDAKECLKILANKRKLGVVADATYHYRRRRGGDRSAIQSARLSRDYYFPCLQYFSEEILLWAKGRFGQVPKFLQFSVLHELQSRLRLKHEDVEKVFDVKELEQYKAKLFSLLDFFEDDVILKQKKIYIEHKCWLLSKKHRESPVLQKSGNDLEVCVGAQHLRYMSQCKMRLERLWMDNDELWMEGEASFLGIPKETRIQVYLKVNDKALVECKSSLDWKTSTKCLGEQIFPSYVFQGRVGKLSSQSEWRFRVFTSINGIMVERKDLRVGKYFPVGTDFSQSYALLGEWMARLEGNEIVLARTTEEEIQKQESKLQDEVGKESKKAATELARWMCAGKIIQRLPTNLHHDIYDEASSRHKGFFRKICASAERIPVSNGSRYYKKRKWKSGWITDDILYDALKDACDNILLEPEKWKEQIRWISWLFIISR